MKKSLLIMLMIFTSTYTFSQVIDTKDYDKYNIETLPVLFVAPESEINNIKEELATLATGYWLNENFKIVTNEEAKAALKNKENVVIAEFQGCSYTNTGISTGRSVNRFVLEYKRKTILSLLIEDQIGKADVVYALKTAQFLIQNRHKFKNPYTWKESPKYFGQQLKQKTLLVPQEYLDKMTADDIKAVYPYPFEVVDESTITEKVLSGSDEYLAINFGNYLWTDGKTSSMKIVYSINDGSIVTYSMAKISFGSSASGHTLKDKDFEMFVKEIE